MKKQLKHHINMGELLGLLLIFLIVIMPGIYGLADAMVNSERIISEGFSEEMPDQELPDQELPDQEFPDEELPDQELPDQELPDQELPNQELPDEELQDQEMPDEEPPDQGLPFEILPDDKADDTLPNEELPEREFPAGSISGFFWIDGDGSLYTGGDGLYNGDEQPLADYTVYLYYADDLSKSVDETVTDDYGIYIFENLETGNYVLGLLSESISDIEYLLPLTITGENKFAIDKSSEPLTAFTEVIRFKEEQAVKDINAGLIMLTENTPLYFMPEPLPTVGGISGFLWVDGDVSLDAGESLDTDGDGIFNGDEPPLANYKVYLYLGDENMPAGQTLTDENGIYIFEDLEPGDYIVGLSGAVVDGEEYLPPMSAHGESVFTMDAEHNPTMSFTEPVEVPKGAYVAGINGGMLPALMLDDTYEATIDLSNTLNSTGNGYEVTNVPLAYNDKYIFDSSDTNGPLTPSGSLVFNTGANEKAYHIIQTGVYKGSTPPSASLGPKYGTSMYSIILIESGADVTLVISDIHLIGSIRMESNAKLTLMLDGENYIRSVISVPANCEITIKSLNANNTSDRLVMPSNPNTSSNNAKIGGPGGSGSSIGNSAGKITIEGGWLDITARSTGACIGGGGRGNTAGEGGSGGNITINGGVVSVTQYGSATDIAYDYGKGFSGAGIGGGGGIDSVSVGGDAGNLVINGGTVTVKQYTRAAGIGGGTFGPAGNITITGGNIDVQVININGNTNDSSAGSGAAIGTAAGANPGTGNITISGGTVNAVSTFTGIGRIHSAENAILNIDISGGTVFAKGANGPGIGYWAESFGSMISITGGTVLAYSENSTAIGCSMYDKTKFHLDAAANVRAYAGGTLPAIYVNGAPNDNTSYGNGYYVNASLTNVISTTADTTLQVFYEGDWSEPLKTLTLPANYRHFAYSSDIANSRTDNIFAKNGAVTLGAIVRDQDSQPQIYSVQTRNGYSAHNGTNGALPVRFNEGLLSYEIRYKANNGTAQPDYVYNTGLNSGTHLIATAMLSATGFTAPALTPRFLGWNTNADGSGVQYAAGANISISGSTTLYAQWDVNIMDLLISKTVEGAYGDRTEAFGFTIYFADGSGPLAAATRFAYTKSGAGLAAPEKGELVLVNGGLAEFALKHGQSITIHDIVDGCMIRIVEENTSPLYTTAFVDSLNNSIKENGRDTGGVNGALRLITPDRAIHFYNERVVVAPTGIVDGDTGAAIMLALIPVLILLAFKAILHRRRRDELV